MKITEEDLRKVRFEQFKDAVILLFGIFGLSFVIPAYIYVMLHFLSSSDLSKTLLLAIFYSELLIFAILTPHVNFLLEITRSAIGRRTPYLLTFGTLVAFLLTAIRNATVDERSITAIIVIILSFNFSMYFYSLTLLGLMNDRKTYVTEKFLESQWKFWSVIGIISSYLYSWKLCTDGRTISHVSLLFLISVFAVSFLIIEDKKFKVKISPDEKSEIYEKYKSQRKPKIKFEKLRNADLKRLFSLIITYQFLFLLPIHIAFVTDIPKNQIETTGAKVLLFYSFGVICNYILHRLIKNTSSIFEKMGHVTIASVLFIFSTTFLLPSINWSLIVSFTMGFLLFPTLSKYFYVPGLGIERFICKERVIEKNIEYYTLYLSVLFSGILFDIFGLKTAGVITACILVALLIIELITTRAKINNTSNN
ncbi:hypothetical protein [Fervidobacterium sp.]